MASAKKTMVHVGLVAIPVRLEVAVDSDSGSGAHAVCTGPEDSKHDPIRVRQSVGCPTCETVHSSVWGFTERGVETDGKVVVLSKEELREAAGNPVKEMVLAFHPREQVYGATVASDSVQNMVPEKGGERGYTALRAVLLKHPDMVATSQWAPSTKNALWVLEVVGSRIVASKRAWPEDVRATVEIPVEDVPDGELAMFDMLVEAKVTDFDVSTYRDTSREAVNALVAARSGEAVAITTKTTTAPTVDMMSALQASVAAIPSKPKAVAAKRPARKRATKKSAAAPLSKTA